MDKYHPTIKDVCSFAKPGQHPVGKGILKIQPTVFVATKLAQRL